jgi:hypothetical protein
MAIAFVGRSSRSHTASAAAIRSPAIAIVSTPTRAAARRPRSRTSRAAWGDPKRPQHATGRAPERASARSDAAILEMTNSGASSPLLVRATAGPIQRRGSTAITLGAFQHIEPGG